MMRLFAFSFLVVVCFAHLSAALQKEMTEEQLQAWRQLARVQCTFNVKIGDDLADAVRDGNFSPDRNLKQKEISSEQLNAWLGLTRNQCMFLVNVSADLANTIRDGYFSPSPDRNLKCYADCIFDHLHIAMKGQLLSERAIRHAYAMLPEHMRDEYVAGIESCNKAGEGQTDNCDFAYELAKCLHDHNVKVFA